VRFPLPSLRSNPVWFFKLWVQFCLWGLFFELKNYSHRSSIYGERGDQLGKQGGKTWEILGL
jgi:hypothetical protein